MTSSEYCDEKYEEYINSVKNKVYFVRDKINNKNYFITEKQLLRENYYKK